MNINQFVYQNQLQPADAIVLKKKFMGMVDHYAIYLGTDDFGTPEFVANFTKGVKIIPEIEINKQLESYIPNRIERFEGNRNERNEAVSRALSRIGEKAYNYIANNCEHFKNWVHHGELTSKQVDNAGNVAAIGGTAMVVGGLLTSNKKTRNWGTGILALGFLLKSFAERK